VPGIAGDGTIMASGVTQEPEGFTDISVIPAEHRAGNHGRRDGRAVVMIRSGENASGYPLGCLVLPKPGERLQVRGQRLVA
jgi:hypothetical protein